MCPEQPHRFLQWVIIAQCIYCGCQVCKNGHEQLLCAFLKLKSCDRIVDCHSATTNSLSDNGSAGHYYSCYSTLTVLFWLFNQSWKRILSVKVSNVITRRILKKKLLLAQINEKTIQPHYVLKCFANTTMGSYIFEASYMF